MPHVANDSVSMRESWETKNRNPSVFRYAVAARPTASATPPIHNIECGQLCRSDDWPKLRECPRANSFRTKFGIALPGPIVFLASNVRFCEPFEVIMAFWQPQCRLLSDQLVLI